MAIKFFEKCQPSEATVRTVSRFLYQAEAQFGGVILGIVTWYLSHWEDTEKYPGARLVFTETFAGLSIIYGSILIWTWNWFPTCYAVINFVFCVAFFAAYGATIEWDCDENWMGWKVLIGESYKSCWKAVESFTFINGFCFLVSTICALKTTWSAEAHRMHMLYRKSSHGSSTAPTEQV
ncbi:hypothetical protein G647_06343 [Cladophialophora carrionii CBS 160.54]|uniref:MARVEL domain-containing protein n=1 Tax=Cladophialophora carrionii CBS 160.54 TaxID=1279043 RepID=V9D5W3_9EURO|nr:uncharacterized protein G647_06343 [Cladophialophora carrionii CBS 160.54]ETI22270.1 hypothetical protein G647_06343 [Cladophialophora carrionii CBS 160.54]